MGVWENNMVEEMLAFRDLILERHQISIEACGGLIQ